MMRNIQTFPSKQMYPYLSLVFLVKEIDLEHLVAKKLF